MIRNTVATFREHFEFPAHLTASSFRSWFPSHMAQGLKAFRAMLSNCDCVIEVHDARIPNVGRNPNFYEFVAAKPKILMLNKVDLADHRKFQAFSRKLKDFGVSTFDCNCKEIRHKNVRKIVPAMIEMIKAGSIESNSHDSCESTSDKTKTGSYRFLICGIPNTGKSSLINTLRRTHLRKGKATPVGSLPGVTKSLMNKIMINENPKIYIYDTPGVIPPEVKDVETGMKLAVVGSFPDHHIGEDFIADYLLYNLNKQRKYQYVQAYGLPGPCDDFETVSMFIARKTGFWDGDKPNYLNTSSHFLRRFRKGELGRIFLAD